jgi:hypothetical protein
LNVEATQLDGRPPSNFSEKYVVALAAATRNTNNFIMMIKCAQNFKKSRCDGGRRFGSQRRR